MKDTQQWDDSNGRSSRSQMSFKKGALKKFHNIHSKTPELESLINKFLKKRLQYRWFM